MKGYGKLLLGLLTTAGLAVSLVMSSGAASAATTTVAVGENFFCSESFNGSVCTTTITAGDTVMWDFSGADVAHTVTECGASCASPAGSSLFDSGVAQSGDTYQFTFATVGSYNYYCQIHAFDQQGKIVVLASAATPASGGGLPAAGYGPQADSSSQWWAFLALAALGATLVSISALSLVRSRQR